MIPLIVVIIAFTLFLVFHVSMIIFIFRRFFSRFTDEYIDRVNSKDKKFDPVREEMIECRNRLMALNPKKVAIKSFDGLKLVAKYFNQLNDKLVILCHGAHSLDYNNFSIIADRFLKEHYNVLLINQRAHGDSEGKYLTYGKKESIDILSWIKYASQKLKVNAIYVYGISMGATALCLASDKINNPKVKGLVVDSPYTSLKGLIAHLTKYNHIPSFLFLRSVSFLAKHVADVGFDEFRTIDAMKNNKIPTFFVFGEGDNVVTKDFLIDNYVCCPSIKEELIVENAGHTLAMPIGGDEAFNKLFNFLKENR